MRESLLCCPDPRVIGLKGGCGTSFRRNLVRYFADALWATVGDFGDGEYLVVIEQEQFAS